VSAIIIRPPKTEAFWSWRDSLLSRYQDRNVFRFYDYDGEPDGVEERGAVRGQQQ
jgi:hypothetical protein